MKKSPPPFVELDDPSQIDLEAIFDYSSPKSVWWEIQKERLAMLIASWLPERVRKHCAFRTKEPGYLVSVPPFKLSSLYK